MVVIVIVCIVVDFVSVYVSVFVLPSSEYFCFNSEEQVLDRIDCDWHSKISLRIFANDESETKEVFLQSGHETS